MTLRYTLLEYKNNNLIKNYYPFTPDPDNCCKIIFFNGQLPKKPPVKYFMPVMKLPLIYTASPFFSFRPLI